MKAARSFSAAIESALNAWLRQDARSTARLASLESKVIEIRLTGVDFSIFFLPESTGIKVTTDHTGVADTRISGSPLNLLAAMRGGNEDRLFQGDLKIEGDAVTGQEFRSLLAGVEFDWEEQLSRLTGDMVARQAGRLARSLDHFLSQGRETLRLDLGEYLQEEARLLPTQVEMERFLQSVDQLREDTDRLTARLRRISFSGGAPR